jgi:hypothetical protein
VYRAGESRGCTGAGTGLRLDVAAGIPELRLVRVLGAAGVVVIGVVIVGWVASMVNHNPRW